jgi:3-oxoacyl-[acyl-carrier-protein] synthase-3
MSQPLPLKILGVGRYLPKRVVTNEEIEKLAGLPAGIIQQTNAGVRERHWVQNETASWMGAQAAKEAIEDAKLTLNDIDLILNASGTQEQVIPDGAPLLQRHLGLGQSGVPGMSIHATCISFLVALNVAAHFVGSGQYRHILIVSSDIASKGINPKEYESFVLFGDCAAAVVVGRTPEGESSRMESYALRTYGEGAYYTCVMGGGTKRHPNAPETKPEDNLFHMDGMKVFQLAIRHSAEILELVQPGLSKNPGDIALVVSHQASRLALKALERFGFKPEQIVVTIDRLGNCVAASLPATLYEAVRDERIKRGEKMLLVGTGAGLSLCAATLIY